MTTTEPLPSPFPEEPDKPALRVVSPDEVADPGPELAVSEVIRTPAPSPHVTAEPVTADRATSAVAAQEVAPVVAPIRPVAGTLSYVATGLTVAAQLTLGGVAWIRQPDPVVLAMGVIGITICGLLLMCAEMIPRALANQKAMEQIQA